MIWASITGFVIGTVFGFWFACNCLAGRMKERLTKSEAKEFIAKLERRK